MQGTVSLGIYDHTGKLVRVLHRQATGDEFVAALDGYITHWDGLDDNGKPSPPGHYSARGYMVGPIKVTAIPLPTPLATGSTPIPSPSPAPNGGAISPGAPIPGLYFPNGKPFVYQQHTRVGLADNPLDRDREGSADLSVALDANGVPWLRLADGLPLDQITPTPHFDKALMSSPTPGAPLVIFLVKQGAPMQAFTITNISSMMAFDCGPFDLPDPAK